MYQSFGLSENTLWRLTNNN